MPSKEIVFSLSDVEEAICAFEAKYKVTSMQFLSDQKLRQSLSEDEVFEWESFIDHRSELLEISKELHRDYLQQVSPACDNSQASKDELALAA